MGIPKPLAIGQLIAHSNKPELAERLDAIHTDFITRMIRFYRTDPSVHEIAGSSDVFRRLRAAGVKVALDTGFSRDIVDVILDRLRWNNSEVVDATVASDEVSRGRPRPDMIVKIMRDLGIDDVKRVAKVGDTPSDLQEGTNAGCGLVVGVTGGSHTADQLEPFPHTHLIGSIVELPALLRL
jgi:phosphonatase-like hydrolase